MFEVQCQDLVLIFYIVVFNILVDKLELFFGFFFFVNVCVLCRRFGQVKIDDSYDINVCLLGIDRCKLVEWILMVEVLQGYMSVEGFQGLLERIQYKYIVMNMDGSDFVDVIGDGGLQSINIEVGKEFSDELYFLVMVKSFNEDIGYDKQLEDKYVKFLFEVVVDKGYIDLVYDLFVVLCCVLVVDGF